MKQQLTIFIMMVICFLLKAKGQSEHVENKWVRKDSIFIKDLSEIYKTNPTALEKSLSYNGNMREKLGFGYYMVSGGTGKGYVSIFYEFIYYKNKLVSYKLEPQMPRDIRLIDRYLNFYSKLFNINKDHILQTRYYGYDEMCKPISDYQGQISLNNRDMQFFMTPFSGIIYGDFGGFGNNMLDNRANYLRVEKLINPKICELLLYSKNPATRLSAIEYYYKNPKLFKNNNKRIEDRINLIFKELPEVLTMSADEELEENAKDLVKRIVKQH